MATAVAHALAEIEDRLAIFAPQHEGLRDYARLNLAAPTLVVIRAAIEAYDRRGAALQAAHSALLALSADGHPDLPVWEIAPEALADLQANAATIEAALQRFGSNAAVSVVLEAGDPMPK